MSLPTLERPLRAPEIRTIINMLDKMMEELKLKREHFAALLRRPVRGKRPVIDYAKEIEEIMRQARNNEIGAGKE